MNTLETLRAARKKIEDIEHWMQGDISDCLCPWSSEATKWCAVGAIACVQQNYCDKAAEEALMQAMFGNQLTGIGDFNDTHTHAEVLAAFDEAIARLEAK